MRYIALLIALLLPEAASIGAAPAVQVEWSRELWAGHGAASGGVAVSDDGSVFVVGTSRIGPGDTDLTLWRLDAHGKVQWRRRLGGPRPDTGTAVAIAPDGDVIVAGDSMSLRVHGEKRHGSPDLLTARYSASGALEWVRRQGRCGPTYASNVSANGPLVVVTGSHQGSDMPCRARPNSAWYAPVSAVVVAYSPTGDKLWTRALQPDGGGDAAAAAAVVGTNGDVYVTGKSMSWYGHITARLFAARLSPEGMPVWTRTFLSTGEAQGQDAILADDGVLIAGNAVRETPGSSRHGMLAIVTRDGGLARMRLYGRPGRAYLFAALCVVDEDQVVAGGRVLVPGDDNSFTSEAWLAAYERDGTPAWSLTSPEGERADALVDLAAGGGDRFVALGLREVTGSPHEVSVVVTSYVIN